MWISCGMTCFWKKYQSHTHMLTISNGTNMSLLPPCFSVLKMYIQRLYYQFFPIKTSDAFQIWTKCVENKWEGNRVSLDGRKLDCTPTKEPQNYISHIVWNGVTMFKPLQLKPYKRSKHNICSFQKVHKHSLLQNELVSNFTFKQYQTILVS